ncbi:MAG: sigma-70 family RNA polymerase sigma factor [Thermodesulfobacteriota bacterium]
MAKYQDLLRRTLAGDTRAFDEVVRRFAGMARAQAGQRVRDPWLAEDAVQEAFLAAYLNLAGLRDLDAFPAWLRAIVRSSCARILRAPRRAILFSDAPGAEDLPADPSDPDLDPVAHFARFQSRDMVLSFLASLSGVLREAAAQRYLLGLTYEEIAAGLGKPVGTIKRRLHAARDRMVRRFENRDRDVVRVGCLPISDHLLAMVAHQQHGQAGFRVALRKFLTWSSLAKALANGGLDMAMLMAPLAMHLHARGAPLVWARDGHHEGSAVAVQADLARRGAWGRGPGRVLAGATLAIPHAFSTHGVLLRALLGFGRADGPGPFRPRYLSPPFVLRPLARGELDGFFCAEPWGLLSEAAGTGRVLLRSRDLFPGHVCCVLAASRAFAAGRPDLLRGYLRLLDAAADYVRARPRESAAIQARYTGVDAAAAAEVLLRGHVNFRDLSPDRGRAEQTMRLALDAGVLDRPCDLDSLLPSGRA